MGGEMKRRRSVAAAVVPAISLWLPRPAASSARRWLAANLPFWRLAARPWPRRVFATAVPGGRLPMPWMTAAGFLPVSRPAAMPQDPATVRPSVVASAGSGDPRTAGGAAGAGPGAPRTTEWGDGRTTGAMRSSAAHGSGSEDAHAAGRQGVLSPGLWLMPMSALRTRVPAARFPAPDWRRAAQLAAAAKIPVAGVSHNTRETGTARVTQARSASEGDTSTQVEVSRASRDGGTQTAVPADDSPPVSPTPPPSAVHPAVAGPSAAVSADAQSIIALVQKKPFARTGGEVVSAQQPGTTARRASEGETSVQLTPSGAPSDGVMERAVPTEDASPVSHTLAPSTRHPAVAGPSARVPADAQSIIAMVKKKPHARTAGELTSAQQPATPARSASAGAAPSQPLPSQATEIIRAGPTTSRGESLLEMLEYAAVRRGTRLSGVPLPGRATDIGTRLAKVGESAPIVGHVLGSPAVVAHGAGDSPALPHPAVRGAGMLPPAWPAVTTVLDTVRTLVQREVKTAVDKYADHMAWPTARERKDETVPPPTAELIANDRLARQLFRQLRELAQEDRFRSGLLNGS